MIELGPDHKIAITGAGGWLGTELLELLLAQHGAEKLQSSVVCFGSRARNLRLSDGTELEITELNKPFSDISFAGVVHLAFQTKDKVAVLGNEKYSYENLQITSRAVQLIEAAKPKWIATVSSGAVLASPGGPLESDVVANPYGFTKRIEETLLTSVAKELGSNLAIGRLWGAMGRYMPPNNAYAVSDFITTALSGNDITIKAKQKVYRRYVNAGEFMHVLLRTAERKELSNFDSGGHLVEMSELANLVAEACDVQIAPRVIDPALADNVYYPTSSQYEALAQEFSIQLSSQVENVDSAFLGHKFARHKGQSDL